MRGRVTLDPLLILFQEFKLEAIQLKQTILALKEEIEHLKKENRQLLTGDWHMEQRSAFLKAMKEETGPVLSKRHNLLKKDDSQK